jgi:predicted short-subunit dehydrogenase-like oxidoreductase (DUF2520 family)
MRHDLINRPDEAQSRASDREAALVLAVVGAGRAGGAVSRAARAAGVEVRLAGRGEVPDAAAGATAVLLCVPDQEIESACGAVAAGGPPAFVGHLSGATSLRALASAAERGAGTFSLHPLQTIPDAETELTGTPCAVSAASAPAREFAESLARRLGMRPFPLDDERRAAYHAAASIASNFLVVLEEAAARLLAEAGIEDPREVLSPLVLRTAANWSERGSAALTGPIARGDEATVEAHLEALAEHSPELIDSYRALAERARAIAAGASERELSP